MDEVKGGPRLWEKITYRKICLLLFWKKGTRGVWKLCFLVHCVVCGFDWNHSCVHRIRRGVWGLNALQEPEQKRFTQKIPPVLTSICLQKIPSTHIMTFIFFLEKGFCFLTPYGSNMWRWVRCQEKRLPSPRGGLFPLSFHAPRQQPMNDPVQGVEPPHEVSMHLCITRSFYRTTWFIIRGT